MKKILTIFAILNLLAFNAPNFASQPQSGNRSNLFPWIGVAVGGLATGISAFKLFSAYKKNGSLEKSIAKEKAFITKLHDNLQNIETIKNAAAGTVGSITDGGTDRLYIIEANVNKLAPITFQIGQRFEPQLRRSFQVFRPVDPARSKVTTEGINLGTTLNTENLNYLQRSFKYTPKERKEIMAYATIPEARVREKDKQAIDFANELDQQEANDTQRLSQVTANIEQFKNQQKVNNKTGQRYLGCLVAGLGLSCFTLNHILKTKTK
jgi:hypothetical protein